MGCAIGSLAVGLALATVLVIYFRRRRSHVHPIMDDNPFSPSEPSLHQHWPLSVTQEVSYVSRGSVTISPAPTPLIIPPSKAIREAENRERVSGNLDPIQGPSVRSETYASSHDTSGTVAYISGLREEMDNLRRDMQQMRSLRSEPPPVYQVTDK